MNRKQQIIVIGAILVAGLSLLVWLPPDDTASLEQPPASVLSVEVVTPQVSNWPTLIRASGAITAWQEIIVNPETGGLALTELLVDVGDSVSRGQVLARLSDTSLKIDLRQQQALVAEAQANLELALSNLKRARIVEDSGSLSAQNIEEYRINAVNAHAALDSAQATLDSIRLKLSQTRIVAADDGVVASKSGVLGSVTNTGEELYRLVRQNRLEWRPELDSRQVMTIRPGLSAHLTLPDGTPLEGQVRLVEPTLSTSTGRAAVYVRLPSSRARAGMFANGRIEIGDQPALTLPESSVVMRDGRAYVFLLDDDDRASSRPVDTGRRQDDRVEVMGLDASTRVVKSGGAFLSEGARVSVITHTTAPHAAEQHQ